MRILTASLQTELLIKRSRFLAELLPCDTQAAARELLKQQKQKYAGATHVVHAFAVGAGAETCGMSDDGEPSGTAGRPALDALQGADCTNALLTVTRWFGGVLLGTGGLVKAYGDSAKTVLTAAEACGALETLVPKVAFAFRVDYADYEKIKRRGKSFALYEVTEDFGQAVTVRGKIRADEEELFLRMLIDATNGKVLRAEAREP